MVLFSLAAAGLLLMCHISYTKIDLCFCMYKTAAACQRFVIKRPVSCITPSLITTVLNNLRFYWVALKP